MTSTKPVHFHYWSLQSRVLSLDNSRVSFAFVDVFFKWSWYILVNTVYLPKFTPRPEKRQVESSWAGYSEHQDWQAVVAPENLASSQTGHQAQARLVHLAFGKPRHSENGNPSRSPTQREVWSGQWVCGGRGLECFHPSQLQRGPSGFPNPLTHSPALTIVRTPHPSGFRASSEMICCR